MPGPEFDQWLLDQRAGLAERVDSGGDDGASFHGTLGTVYVDRQVYRLTPEPDSGIQAEEMPRVTDPLSSQRSDTSISGTPA